MNLIQLLKQSLTEWPVNDCVCITQDSNGTVFYWRGKPELDPETGDWEGPMNEFTKHRHTPELLCDDVHYLHSSIDFDVCEDQTTAIVTKDAFMKFELGSNIVEWRDRLKAIEVEINALGVERHMLTAKLREQNLMVV